MELPFVVEVFQSTQKFSADDGNVLFAKYTRLHEVAAGSA
jgi:hypothetical protein